MREMEVEGSEAGVEARVAGALLLEENSAYSEECGGVDGA